MANIADNISRHARAEPRRPALVHGRRTLDFGALDRAISRAAAALRAQGLRAGETVGLALGNDALHLVTGLALARMGAVQLALPRMEDPALRRRLAKLAGMVALVGESPDAAPEGVPLLRPDPAWLEVGGKADGAAPEGAGPAPGGDAGWMIVLTSGTTGAPKAVLQSHSAYAARRALNSGPAFFLPGDRYFSVMSLGFHLGYRTCIDALWSGASVELAEPFRSGADLCAGIQRSGANWLFLMPTHLDAMLPRLAPDRPLLPGVRVLRTAAMNSSDALRQAVRLRLTPNLYISYGINDLGCAAAQADPGTQLRFPGTVGMALPGVELAIADEAGRPLPAGEVGQVRIRIPDMPPGYLGNPEASAAAFRDGWFLPGDLGVLSPEGALTLKGRADDQINFSGAKIYPADIEAALLEHPAVAEAAAFPLASARHQQVPVVAVVLREQVDSKALSAWCRQRLGTRTPKHIVFVSALPRNEMGKVRKRELASLVASRIPRD